MRWALTIREYLIALIALILPIWQEVIPLLLVLLAVVTIFCGGFRKALTDNKDLIALGVISSVLYLLFVLSSAYF